LIHTYSLIHDDLPAMDNDTLRRGRPTLHVVYGTGIAILAGDALQAEAFALLAREPVSDDASIAARKLAAMQVIADAAGARGMVGGQTIDLQAAGQAPGHAMVLDADGLRAMHLRKTGALIRASAVSGAIMAGGGDDTIAAVERWATQIGLAFQIVDDILDVEGASEDLGKTAGKDAAAGKATMVAVLGTERARSQAEMLARQAAGHLDSFGERAKLLQALAAYVVTRRN
jgi:geranylgeranyl pyrophosphate synthase